MALKEGLFWGRSAGTVGDPRHYAYVLAIGVAASMAKLFHAKTIRLWLLSAAMLLLCLAAIMLTASRTGIAAAILVLFIGMYLFRTSPRRFFRYLMWGGMFLPIFFTVYLEVVPQGTKDRLFQTEEISFQRSLAGRQRDTLEPFVKALDEPMILLTGRGPAKEVFPGSEHSDIGWMTLHFGLFGMACYLAIFHRSFRAGLLNYRRSSLLEERFFAMFALMALGDWMLFALAESIFKHNQLMSINLFIVGCVFAPMFKPQRVDDAFYPDIRGRIRFASEGPRWAMKGSEKS